MKPEDALSAEQVAARIQTSAEAVISMIQGGELAASYIDGAWWVQPSEVERWERWHSREGDVLSVSRWGGTASELPGRRERQRPFTVTSGMLLAGALAPLSLAHHGRFSSAPLLVQAAAVLTAFILLVGSLTIRARPRVGQVLATFGLVGTLSLSSPSWAMEPSAALVVLLAGLMAMLLLWGVGRPLYLIPWRREVVYRGQAVGAAAMTLLLWFIWTFAHPGWGPLDSAVAGYTLLVYAGLSVEWALRRRREDPLRAGLVVLVLALTVTLTASYGGHAWMMSALASSAFVGLLLNHRASHIEMESTSWWEPLLGHPERLFVGTFALLCVGGTILLALPQSAAKGVSIGFVDAAFTATSAVCVTGLAVLDTAVDFSGFGQAVLLLLIQIGGLGIMTFSTAALWVLGRRVSLRHEGVMASLVSPQDRGRLFSTLSRVLGMTLAIEGVGAVLLTAEFVQRGEPLMPALWRGVFTSISAFCNAGFALQSDSLVSFAHAPVVLHTVALLIIFGGLSPLVVFSLPRLVFRSAQPVAAQAKLALASSLVLLLIGFGYYLAFEWSDSLAGLSAADRIHNAWFQAVTLRTAGFNSVDLSLVHPSTFSLMLVWMLIGGNPGGTAGGVKTTTVAVLLLSVVAAIRARPRLVVFKKTIPEGTVVKAAVVLTVAITTGLSALVVILLTQAMPARDALFEVISALGTVGLTIGGTARLDGIGKAVIIGCMFAGRVGGLTLLMFLSSRRSAPVLGRPEEEIDVG